MDTNTNIMTPRDIAKELNTGVNWVYQRIKAGEIPAVHVGDRYFLSRAAFDRWAAGEQNQQKSGNC